MGCWKRTRALVLMVLHSACAPPENHGTSGIDDSGEPTGEEDIVFPPVSVLADGMPPQRLSETNLIVWDGTALHWHPESFEYEINTPLFSDYAIKRRTIWIPDGHSAVMTDAGPLDFPVGTVITKTFLFASDMRAPQQDQQVVETRLMIRGTKGWKGWPYVWRADGQDAVLDVTGDVQQISFVDVHGEPRTAQYLVPQQNQCIACHESRSDSGKRTIVPIGPSARQLHRPTLGDSGGINQLEVLVQRGMLTGLTSLDAIAPATDFESIDAHVAVYGVDDLAPDIRDRAARDYLDANCAHCHNPQAVEGLSSQLWLNHDNEDAFHLGICKRPTSAGEGTLDRHYDIVPGDSYESVLWYRLNTEILGAMMPQIGRSLSHHTGSELVAAWIDDLPQGVCSTPIE